MPGSQNTTIHPNGEAGGGLINDAPKVGAGSYHSVLSDGSDATYLQFVGPASAQWAVTLGSPGLLDTDIIQSVQIIMRMERTTGGPTTGVTHLYDGHTGKGSTFVKPVTALGPSTVASPLFTNIGGEKITAAVLERIVVFGDVEPNARLYELSVVVNYNSAPTVSAVGPSGVVAGDANPLITWTYDDPEGDPQERFQVKVYDAATVAAAGSPATPPLAPAVHSSGVITAAAPQYQLPINLKDGAYRVYVLAADQGSNGRYSAWAFADFALSLGQPATPIIVASTYDEQFGRIPLFIQGLDNLLSEHQGGAENATADYTLVNATATLDTTAAKIWNRPDGPTISTKSLKLTASSAASISAATPPSAATAVPVAAGETIIAGAHVFSTTCRLATAGIRWVDDTNAFISTTTGKQIPTAVGPAPAPVFVTAVAPVNAVAAVVIITVISPANAEVHWIDDFFLAPAWSPAGAPQDAAVWNGNMVANTSFESYQGSVSTTIPDWGISVGSGQGATVAADASISVDGTQVVVLSKQESSLAPPYMEWPNLAGSVPRLPVVAGNILVVIGYQHVVSGNGVTIEAVYQDGTHDQVTCTAAPVSGYEPFVAAFQIPSGKTGVSFRILPVAVGANSAQGVVRIDVVNIYFANTQLAATFPFLGGTSGTPIGAGLGSTGQFSKFAMATHIQPFFPWTRGGFTPLNSYLVERTVDGGVTWTTVRGDWTIGNVLSVLGAVGYDYEAPPGAQVLYRATVVSADPVSAAPVTSALSLPFLPDPGFEEQLWTGGSTDPFALQYQPPFGSFVGAMDAATPGPLISAPAPLPAWAHTLSIRMLVRMINAAATTVQVTFYDLGMNSLEYTGGSFAVPASSGDSGWGWVQQLGMFVPPSAAYAAVAIAGTTQIDFAKSMLLLADSVQFWALDGENRGGAATTPDCLMWLKDPLNPSSNLAVEIEIGSLPGQGAASASGTESQSTDTQLVMQPSGRATAVILADAVVSAETLTNVQFLLKSDQEWFAFETLRKSQRTLLLQVPYGDLIGEQYYVRLADIRTAGRVQTQDQNRNQRRRVTISAREVDAP